MILRKSKIKSVFPIVAAFWLGLSALLSGCGGAPAVSTSEAESSVTVEETEEEEIIIEETEGPTASAKRGKYVIPKMLLSEYKGEKAKENRQVEVDESSVSDGYIGFSVKADSDVKIKMMKDDEDYEYSVKSDGTPSIFPLQMGSGVYSYIVCQRREGTKFAVIQKGEVEVELSDEFQPFLRPSDYVPYDRRSDSVKKASEFARAADTSLDVVKSVYEYVTKNIKYDVKKAEKADTDIPADPDKTMKTGYGICLDYAALAAAMLRSQGIPTRMIYGYVGEDDLYHAWNMFYTEETGWVTVKFEVKKKETWYRLDLTFSAGGAPEEFVGDGSNYRDIHTY